MTAPQNERPTDRDEEAALWCVTLAEGELPRHQRELFDAWISEPENERAFGEAASVWNSVDGAAALPALVRMRSQALADFTASNRQPWTGRVSRRWPWIGAVAATFLIALVALLLLRDPTRLYQTGIGERSVAMLEDGSKLSLDADSEVEVRLGKDRRELTLVHGRAKFDVAHDPLRPFAVTAGDKIVVATGTSFSVEVLGSQIRVLLYEGRVAVLDRRDDQPVRQRIAGLGRAVAADQALLPGKELIASIGVSDGATIVPADGQQSLAWESGQLSFDDEPLSSAVVRMNRYSRDKLALGDERLATIRVNGVFTAGDNEAFVEGIAALNPVQIDRQPGRITLKSR